jgi:Glycosyl transferases group 1
LRLFQNARYYPALRPRIRELTRNVPTFSGKINAFLDFRYSAAHVLQPVDQRLDTAFFANGDDMDMQRVWAAEHGMSSRASLQEILKAQIEEHRTEVFYNHDATGWDADFIKNLPQCVKYKIVWHAVGYTDLTFYDRVVCNFPSILADMHRRGCRVEYLYPAYDPELSLYAGREDRPIDMLFVGGYSRHHKQRAHILEEVAKLAANYNVVYCLDRSRFCRLAESPIGRIMPLGKHRRPDSIRMIARYGKFGRDYYELLASAKVVLNGSIDMAGADRGNMRCFEALGAGSMLLSDQGIYPKGMSDGHTIMTYHSPQHAVQQAKTLLEGSETRLGIARAGHQMVSTVYSKEAQWKSFEAIVASI